MQIHDDVRAGSLARLGSLLAALSCALLACLCVAESALAAEVVRFEGESMNTSGTTGISVAPDAAASGLQSMMFTETGDVASKSVTFSSAAEKVAFRVRGEDQSNQATMPRVNVYVDGTDYALDNVLDAQVSSSYTTYTADLTRLEDRSAGKHTVYVKMASIDKGDRIWVDWGAFTNTQGSSAPPGPSSAPPAPFPGTRFYPVMGVYLGAGGFLGEDNLIDNQYAQYVGANENSYLDLGDNDSNRDYFCGGRKYRWADFLVDETRRPTSAQASDPNWSGYRWNQDDNLEQMLDASTKVASDKARACLFVAFTATSNEGSVPQWMINDPDSLTWRGSGGDHVRMDKPEALRAVTDFYIALIKHYGDDKRIAQLTIGEYFPGTGSPLTSAQKFTFVQNMKIFWTEVIAAAPRDANGKRMAILQSNPITGANLGATDLRAIGVGVSGSDPEMFEGSDTDTLQRALYGDVPTQHQVNANRLVKGYQIRWDGTPNPWGFAAGTTNAIRYEYLAWYHGTLGPTPLDSMLMRDNSTLRAQWHEAYQQNGPNGIWASRWGYIPSYPTN